MAEQPSLSHPIEWLFLSLSPLDITLDVSTAPTYTKSNEKFLFKKKERKKGLLLLFIRLPVISWTIFWISNLKKIELRYFHSFLSLVYDICYEFRNSTNLFVPSSVSIHNHKPSTQVKQSCLSYNIQVGWKQFDSQQKTTTPDTDKEEVTKHFHPFSCLFAVCTR